MENKSLLPGVSGIMRVKNDAQFIDMCIESCIDALDELVIVYNDCSDGSPEIIAKACQRYPSKIKVYPYEHHVLSSDLTRDEYEFVKDLPEGDPHLLSTYYNFALDKVSYKYAIKIDADQLYFSDILAEWCAFYRQVGKIRLTAKVVLGYVIYLHMKFVTVLSRRQNKTLKLLPCIYSERLKDAYMAFLHYSVANRDANVMLSGLNVLEIDGGLYSPLGYRNPTINILPPFNGIGDHVFFKVTDKCYYKKYICEEYSKYRSEKYTVIERFVCPGIYLPGGFMWFHLNMLRPETYDRIESVYHYKSERFIPVSRLLGCSYYQLDRQIPDDMFGRDARSFFQFSYSMFKDLIKRSVHMLDKKQI